MNDNEIEVVAEVGMGPDRSGGFALTVALDVVITGLDQTLAEEYVREAHTISPYSNAVRNNVDVQISVSSR